MVIRLLIILIIILNNLHANVMAQGIQLFEGEDERMLWSREAEFFVDANSSTQLKDILNNPKNYKFKKSTKKEEFSECGHCTYWIRFKVLPPSHNPGQWVLEVLDSRFEEFELFVPDLDNEGNYFSSLAGTKYGFSKREYDHKNFVFNFPLSKNKYNPPYYYIKVNPGTYGSFLMKLRKTQEFASYGFKEYLWLGMYYGILFIMAFYNLFLYFSIKERVYVYYFFYVLIWAISCSFEDGLGFQFIWSDSELIPIMAYYGIRITLLLFYFLYAASFLNLKGNHPKLFRSLYYAFPAYVVLNTLFNIFDLYVLNGIVFLAPFVVLLYVSYKVYKDGYKPARYYLLGNGIIVFGLIINFLKNEALLNGIIDKSTLLMIVLVYIKNICMILDIVILSLALGDRIKFLKETSEKAHQRIIDQLNINQALTENINKELEVKVEERTRTIEEKSKLLEEAYEQMKKQAEEINKMNAMLDMDNWNLKKNIKQEKEARIIQKEVNFAEFSLVYPNEVTCFHYLEELKWANGYSCRKCGNKKFNKGLTPFSRRCSKCRYDESITAFTIFHRCKFEINKALYIAVMINRYGDNMNIAVLSREIEIRNATCWKFFQKVLELRNTKEYEKTNDNERLMYLILHNTEVDSH